MNNSITPKPQETFSNRVSSGQNESKSVDLGSSKISKSLQDKVIQELKEKVENFQPKTESKLSRKFSSSPILSDSPEIKKTEEAAIRIIHVKQTKHEDPLKEVMAELSEQLEKMSKEFPSPRTPAVVEPKEHDKIMHEIMANKAIEPVAIPTQQVEKIKKIYDTFNQLKTAVEAINPNKKLRFSTSKNVGFVVKDKKPFYLRTWKHVRSEKTMENVISNLEDALKLAATGKEKLASDGKNVDASSVQISNLIDQIESTNWGKGVLSRNEKFANRFTVLKDTIDIIKKTQTIRKEITVEADNETDQRFINLLIDMVPINLGDKEILSKNGIITPEALMLTFPMTKMTTQNLFKNINTILKDPKVPTKPDIKGKLVTFTVKFLQEGLYKEEILKEEVQRELRFIRGYCSQDDRLKAIEYHQINDILAKAEEPIEKEESKHAVDQNAFKSWVKEKISSGDVVGFAGALFLREVTNIQNVKLPDLSNEKSRKIGSFKRWAEQFDQLAGLVADEVLKMPSVMLTAKKVHFDENEIDIPEEMPRLTPEEINKAREEGKQVYQFFVKAGLESIKQNNFNSAFAILSGLNNISVSRLYEEDVDDETKMEFSKLETTLSPSNNFANLKKEHEARKDQPYVVLAGKIGKELTSASENSIIDDKNHSFNAESLRILAKTMQELVTSKQSLAKILEKPTPELTLVTEGLNAFQGSSDTLRDKKSEEFKPRVTRPRR